MRKMSRNKASRNKVALTKLNMNQEQDIMQSDYYFYCRYCLGVFGVWPLQNSKLQLFLQVTNFVAVFSVIIPHAVKAFELRNNLPYFLICVPSLFFYCQYISKFVHMIAKNNKCKKIINYIRHDFQNFKGEKLEIIYHYANGAKKFNRIFACYLYIIVVLYNLTAFVPIFLDVLHPLNETRYRPMPRFMKYNIKMLENNFYVICFHGFFFDVLGITLIYGFDAFLVNCVQHSCALFQVVIAELQKITDRDKEHEQLNDADSRKYFYKKLVNTIIMHKRALEYADLLESTYAAANIFVIAFTLGGITLAEFQTVQHKGQTVIMFRFAMYMCTELIHIMAHNYPSQRILDHSLAIYKSCYSCEWYREDIPEEFKKLLQLMILRSQRPSYLTSGGLYILGLENYATILKASLSYFTFLNSF